jgi:O-antigen ligase
MASRINQNTYKTNSSNAWLLLLTPALITLYFNARAQDPFNTPKLIIILLSGSWILGHLLISYKRNIPKLKSEDFVVTLTILFLISMLVAFYFSDNKITALIGDNLRRTGFLTYLALTIIFLFAARCIDFHYSLRLIKIIILTGLFSSCYGIIQMLGNDPVAWNNPYNSIITTVGNPNFASASMAIFTLVSIFGLFVANISKTFKFISCLTIVISLIAITNSQSRQGLLTLLFGIVFYLTLYSFMNLPRIRIPVALGSGILTLLLILGMLQKGPLSGYLYKESVSVRGYYWRAAIEMFRDNPFFGVGLDSYGWYFKEYRELEYVLKYGYDITSSNAHNVILQLFSTGGVFVGVTYLVLVLFTLYTGVNLVKRTNKEMQKVSLLFLSAWIGFQAQAFISIDNLGVTVWGWILAGSIFGLSKNINSTESTGKINSRSSQLAKIEIFQPLVSSIFLVPSLVVSVYLWQAESDAFSVRSLVGLTQYKNVLDQYISELENNPLGDPYYKFESYRVLAESGDTTNSISKIQILLITDSRNLNYLEWLALYQQNQGDFNSAILLRREIVKYDPWNARNFFELGILYKQNGDSMNKSKMLEKIISIADGTEISSLAKIELS